MNTCDAPGSLLERVKKLVKEEKRGLLAVSVKTGVPVFWLRKFAAGKIPNPSVNRIQHLFEKLSGSKLSLKK